MSVKPSNRIQRIRGLDGFRAIAIIGIILYHILPKYVSGGFYGVLIFFMITGYLLAHKTKYELANNLYSFHGFYQKKIWRILPALLLTMIISYIAVLLLLPAFPKNMISESFSVMFGYNNYWQLAKSYSYFSNITKASPFTHLWYLSIISQAYFVWPIGVAILCIVRRKKPDAKPQLALIILCVISALLMCVLYNPDKDPSRIYYGFDTRIFAIILGALIGSVDVEKFDFIAKRPAWLKSLLFSMGLGFTIYAYIFFDGESAFTYRIGMQLASLIFGIMLILILISQDNIGVIVDFIPFSWIGQISYEMYLVMYPVIFIAHQCTKDAYKPKFILIELALIIVISIGIHLIIRAMDIIRSEKRFLIRPALTALLMVITIVLTILQGHLANLHMGVSDVAQMQKELEESSKELEEKNNDNKTSDKKSDKKSSIKDVTQTKFTAIGDSVMLGASTTLGKTFPNAYIDAQESRQFVKAINIASDLDAQGNLNDIVIIGLGTNGPFKETTGQELIDFLGDRQIYWINAYGATLAWQDEVNSTIKSLCDANDNVTLIDWADYAKDHPEWFYSDGIHLKSDGQAEYSEMIKETLEKNLK